MSTTLPTPPAAPVSAAPMADARARVDAVDLLRGLVMVLMLLDHTRDFVDGRAWLFDPADLSRTTPALFLTRWITHFCAPVFVFLAGTGAYLQRARGKPTGELSRFLLTRGLWLVVVELTLVKIGFTFNLDWSYLGVFQVIWAIGVSMIVLAALVHLPTAAVGAFGVATIALHNAFDGVRVAPGPNASALDQLWIFLHQQGPVTILGLPAMVIYPLVPWIGVMAAGYALGAVYGWEAGRRRRFLVRLGAALTVGFVALRLTNLYGDPSPWGPQKDALFTVLSVIDTTKYPPSLLFLMMTLGPALLFLAWAEPRDRGRLGGALVTFGRVPLFFYLLQWPMANGIGLVANWAAGQPAAWHFQNPPERFGSPPVGAGFDLWVVYALWIVGVLLLYPLCRWFAGVKRRRRDWWLGYL